MRISFRSFGIILCLIVSLPSFAKEINKTISAEVGFAATKTNTDYCTLFVTVTNNTEQLIIDLKIAAAVQLFDAEGIFIKHGYRDGELDLDSGPDRLVTKAGASLLLTGQLRRPGIGNKGVYCEDVETVEFKLKEASCTDRRGELLDCNALLDTRNTAYQMSKLLELNW